MIKDLVLTFGLGMTALTSYYAWHEGKWLLAGIAFAGLVGLAVWMRGW